MKGENAKVDADADAGRYYVFVEEMLHRGNRGVAAEFLTTDFVEHGIGGDRFRDEFIEHLVARRARYPGALWTIELLVGVAGLVVCHTTVVKPESSEHAARMWETVVLRFTGGRIAECWRVCDERLLAAEAHGVV